MTEKPKNRYFLPIGFPQVLFDSISNKLQMGCRSYEGKNNPFYGKNHTLETRQKMLGKHMKKIPTYGSLHDYVKYHKPRPESCEDCGELKKLDLANISGEYKRNLDDWEWLCRRCHMKKDGRLDKLIERNKSLVHSEVM